MSRERRALSGTVLNEHTRFTLWEACRVCGVSAELMIEMVTEGVVEPEGVRPREWQFSGVALGRLQCALRLQRDLGVNLAGAALALELLDEVEQLRRACRRLGAE